MRRRSFLNTTLAAAASGAAPFHILKSGPSPNSKLNIVGVGIGRQGSGVLKSMREHNIIGIADVHESWSRRFYPSDNVKRWRDYRRMFDAIGKEIDAVVTATPNHARFAVCMYFLQRGKHIYAEKPLCHTANEARTLAQEAKKHGVVTQMGHQGHSSHHTANIRDWVLAGSVGEIREVIAYSRKNYWTDKAPAKGGEVPSDLDWDLWLNRAGEIPFSESYINRNWIRFNHFSGAVGDMGAHILDPAYYSLDLKSPMSVRADVTTRAKPWSMPPGSVITWEFSARGKMPPVTMKFHLGDTVGQAPRPEHLEAGRKASFLQSGSVLIGQHASIMAGSHSQGARIIPETSMKEIGNAPEKAFRCKPGGHTSNFLRACMGEERAMSPFDYAGPLSEIICLGDVALLHPNKTLRWEAGNMKITNDEAADNSLFLRRLHPRDQLNWF